LKDGYLANGRLMTLITSGASYAAYSNVDQFRAFSISSPPSCRAKNSVRFPASLIMQVASLAYVIPLELLNTPTRIITTFAPTSIITRFTVDGSHDCQIQPNVNR